ncbi:5'-methylthioadenosine/adenosylhomocysteine nucleosidase [Mycobacterium haemophilum]|uniref:adenosylhomocysteine nucleosidase n=1 Tax=Mycobacterium haemophilum TaxID=29311 RepID=A0A0I9UD60_9MYCO|nr:5'-methylthioadenosine/adenosylhomocysteine nucleosidase [Mycobacterium haemophilum]AKN17924.1 nucleosidase [Mycobacterium haemophilum DSM 44634]KLO33577.1 MTA/SAH nucleosidase [Mycobacterium haemophilum]KLO39105.1 MTA/SAH nucleosidase [Mycobacterium haemophilum]KLO45519.1 MTA/SAH nucleosidase [Mycobacterium haemophilum]KLO56670.1 MTA/SAH nucleosidase [Mycobacterium haemophilum]
MTTGLICAIPQELAHLRRALCRVQSQRVAQVSFDIGELDGHRVVVAGGGIGKVNTALAATLLADRFGCHAIVFTGVAGGLDPKLRIGDVVIADRVIQHDAGLIESQRLGVYQAGHVPFINPTERLGYSVDLDLMGRVRHRLKDFAMPLLSRVAGGHSQPSRMAYGTILSGDQYLQCEVTRDSLQRELGGLAIEMEGGALAQVGESFGIPWLNIRCLSDLAGCDSRFDFAAFVDHVAVGSAAILRHLLPVL